MAGVEYDVVVSSQGIYYLFVTKQRVHCKVCKAPDYVFSMEIISMYLSHLSICYNMQLYLAVAVGPYMNKDTLKRCKQILLMLGLEHGHEQLFDHKSQNSSQIFSFSSVTCSTSTLWV